MKGRIAKIFSLVIIFTMLAMPVGAAPVSPGLAEGTTPPRPVKEVPAEIMELFKDGMTIEEFLVWNQGPIPNALESYADTNVTVVVQMGKPSLGRQVAARMNDVQAMDKDSQIAYNQALLDAQAPVKASIKGFGGTVISQYTRAYNGLLVNVPAKQLQAIREMPGVIAVRRAPQHHPELSVSVPLINADDVWSTYTNHGEGISIAVIDTGIDYTHLALGGSGNPLHYTNNDVTSVAPSPSYEVFPTAKVIGGWDFAGTDYDANDDEPIIAPDPDPLDEHGHGTHVASTAAGIGVPGKVGEGVAPAASLYALKIFGVGGSTNLTVDAIEWAMDPDGDGYMDDHVDVINMSIGSDYGPADINDPDIVASDAASALGIVVVSSAGNAGNTPYITGSPSSASSVIAVAASTTGFAVGPTVNPDGTAELYIYMPSDFPANSGHFETPMTAPLGYVGDLSTTAVDDFLCEEDPTIDYAPDALTGMIALIQRGTCAFTVKVNNAAALGAVGALIFNDEARGDSLVTMVGDESVSIPGGFLAHSDGLALQPYHGSNVNVSAETDISTIPSSIPPDTIADFSSRGPRGFDSVLKPDITAPGVGIFAAAVGTGEEGVSFSGTSMASPHVAGVAALLIKEHPDWSPGEVKAAMMNTAVDLVDEASTEIPRQGAGRVDALKAIETTAFAIADNQLISLNWGVVPLTTDIFTDTKEISLQNTLPGPSDYDISWSFGSGSNTDGFNMTVPVTVTLSSSTSLHDLVPVDIEIDATMVPASFDGYLEEYYGFVEFTNQADSEDVLRVPFYVIPQPYAELDITADSVYSEDGVLNLDHTGPITSSLWAYPLFHNGENDPLVGDEADLRMVGMDYGWYSGYGDIFVPAFNVYGSWHTPQPYFAEMDLYLDVDQDGTDDVVNFNFNYGWWGGGDDTDTWIVVQVDFASGYMYLGSPYTIYTDYNTGFMEWYLPAPWQYLGGEDTDFDFFVAGWDYYGNLDLTDVYSFDYARTPIGWGFTNEPGPAEPTADLYYWLDDSLGYYYADPLGLMVVDYNGVAGEGQAYAHLFNFHEYIDLLLPMIQH